MSTTTCNPPEWTEMELCDVGKSIFNDSGAEESFQLKARCVKEAIHQTDIERLRMLAETKDGLMNSQWRHQAWPVLLGHPKALEQHVTTPVARHRDEDQVKLDIMRSFTYISDESLEDVASLRSRLENVILRVLRSYPDLNYYQGYHDIASLVILVFKEDESAFQFLATLTLIHLRDFMLPTMDATIIHLELVTDLLDVIDPSFGKVIRLCNNPFYVLSPILTLFSHNVRDHRALCLVWDYVLTRQPPIFCIYLSATLILHFKDDIIIQLHQEMNFRAGSEERQADFSDFLHGILSDVMCNKINTICEDQTTFLEILGLATSYIERYSMTDVPRYVSNVSCYSVLKTARIPQASIDCWDLFQKQMLGSTGQLRQDEGFGGKMHLGLLRAGKDWVLSPIVGRSTWRRVIINVAFGIISIFVGKYFLFKDESWKEFHPFKQPVFDQASSIVFPIRLVKGILSLGL